MFFYFSTQLVCNNRFKRFFGVMLGRRTGTHLNHALFLFFREGERVGEGRSEEHTSESSHMSISYAVFCLKKKNSSNLPHPLLFVPAGCLAQRHAASCPQTVRCDYRHLGPDLRLPCAVSLARSLSYVAPTAW